MLVSQKGKPLQANLRRATSSAYYAMFHCMAKSCADLLIGGDNAVKSKPAWNQTYRAVDHGPTKSACKDGVIARFPKVIEDFANTFISMQSKRHSADYDPSAKFYKSEVVNDIGTATRAIQDFGSAPAKDRRAFCAFILFKKRP